VQAPQLHAIKLGTIVQEMHGAAGKIAATGRIIFAPESN